MCISKNLSIISFLISIVSSILLIKFIKTNSSKVIGYFFIFVALMQIIDYLIWSDIDCSKGLNIFASKIAPILHYIQPIVLLILIKYYIQPENKLFNLLYYPIIMLYLLYITYSYSNYFNSNNFCIIRNNNGFLRWKWMDYFNHIPYNLLFFFILFILFNDSIIRNSIILSYILLIISFMNFKGAVGELWCFIISSVPLFILFINK